MAARDALVSRIQSELAQAADRHEASERAVVALEARLASASESIGALEAVSSVRSDEERRERDAIAVELSTERGRASRLDTERASALETLRDVRESLARLESGLGDSVRVAANAGAPEGVYREEIARLARDADDREVMLRSLTAQLEERDDRIRALERVARGDTASVDATKVIENEERVARLSAELAEERRARERVESSSASVSREAELRRLEQLIGDRDAQMMLLEGRVEGASREERAMREVFAEARASIETILAQLGSERHGEAAERAAELLRALRKY
jgi:chromosome segregation ATPase